MTSPPHVCFQCHKAPEELIVIRMNNYESWTFCNYTCADKRIEFVRGIAWPFYVGQQCNITLPVCV